MDMLQQVEFVVSHDVAGAQDQEMPYSSAANLWRAWSLVPTASPNGALRRRIAASARVRLGLKSVDALLPLA